MPTLVDGNWKPRAMRESEAAPALSVWTWEPQVGDTVYFTTTAPYVFFGTVRSVLFDERRGCFMYEVIYRKGASCWYPVEHLQAEPISETEDAMDWLDRHPVEQRGERDR